MLPGAASVMSAAIWSPYRSNTDSTAPRSLYGTTMVSEAWDPVTPGESGSPNVATPEPADASRAST